MARTERGEAALRSPLARAMVGGLGVLLVSLTSGDFSPDSSPILSRPQLSGRGKVMASGILYFFVDLRTVHLVAEQIYGFTRFHITICSCASLKMDLKMTKTNHIDRGGAWYFTSTMLRPMMMNADDDL